MGSMNLIFSKLLQTRLLIYLDPSHFVSGTRPDRLIGHSAKSKMAAHKPEVARNSVVLCATQVAHQRYYDVIFWSPCDRTDGRFVTL